MAAIAVKSGVITKRSSNLTNTHLNSIKFKQPLLRFRNNIDLKRGNLKVVENGRRNRVAAVPVPVVRCTAEGIERGIFGGKGQEGNFVIPERLKVVALMACVMCLCNADRVVMSVAIVPLAAKYGWSSSFLGIVQVNLLFFPLIFSFYFLSYIKKDFFDHVHMIITIEVCLD